MKKFFSTCAVSFCLVIFCLLPAWAEEARFVKLDGAGLELDEAASDWVAVLDRSNGLVWEVKSADGSYRDKDALYQWRQLEDEYLPQLNKEKLAGFDDWRVPLSVELRTLVAKEGEGEGPKVNEKFFPHTAAAVYWSYSVCGSGALTTECIDFGLKSDKKKPRRFRAVRGQKLEE